MALTFNGAQLPGFHERVQTGKPMRQIKRTKFAGIWGESEIDLGAGGRPLACKVWLNSPAFGSSASLAVYLDQLDDNVGINSDLIETGSVSKTWSDCVFEGFEPDGPLLPVKGGIGMNVGTWFVAGTMHWYQLTIG